MAGLLCGRIFGARSRTGVVNTRYLKVGIMVTLLSSEVVMNEVPNGIATVYTHLVGMM